MNSGAKQFLEKFISIQTLANDQKANQSGIDFVLQNVKSKNTATKARKKSKNKVKTKNKTKKK
jgi:hypothetical protein